MNAQRQDVALKAELAPPSTVVAADASSLMDVISRAASDPSTDVDKLERLMGLYERITAKSAEQAYDEAMNAAQEEMRPIAADANNPQTKSRYASYAALDRALRPIYTKHGFSLSFYAGEDAPSDHVRIACRVARSGHKERPYLDMPADGKGAKGGDVMTKTHATGAAITYGRRYLLGMIFNIAVGEDDDGNAADGDNRPAAVAAAIAAIDACQTGDALRAWKANNAGALAAFPSDQADAVVRAFNARVRAVKAGAPQ